MLLPAAIVKAMKVGLSAVGLPEELVNLVEDTTRQSANDLMTAVGYVDLLIPRGGAGLIRAVTENAKVPCIQTGTGICHIYVDRAQILRWLLISLKMPRPVGLLSAMRRGVPGTPGCCGKVLAHVESTALRRPGTGRKAAGGAAGGCRGQ